MKGRRYFQCDPKKGIFVSPSFARIEEDGDAVEKTEESQVRERASSSDLLNDEWYTEMFAPELHALEEARSQVSKNDTTLKKETPTPTPTSTPTPTHPSKLEEHQRQLISNFTKNMASGLVRVADEERTEREVAWDLDVRKYRSNIFSHTLLSHTHTHTHTHKHREIIKHASNARECSIFYGDVIIVECAVIFFALDVRHDRK